MHNTDPKDKKEKEREDEEAAKNTSEAEKKQQQSDPQLTELKGLTDPDEDLEVKGTDNPF